VKTDELAERFKAKGDVWVVKYIEDLNTANLLVWMRNKVKSTLVVDIDDNIWQIPEDSIVLRTDKDIEAHAKRGLWTIDMVKAADAVTVSTEPLKGLLKKYNDKIEVIPNLIDVKGWKYKRKKHDKVRIGWIYSHTHYPDLKVIKGALNKIHKKYKDKVEIVIFGSDLDVFDFKPKHYWGVKFDEYPKKLTELSFDISICPLEDNEFNRCKSNIKWMESSMAGAAVVASKVYPYEYSIEHGKTGYLASNENQWVKYLSWLIENEDKRNELVANAKKVILEKYNIETDKTITNFYSNL
jgi:glycosyltransferase involved in cell wall biosynthesis